MYIILLIVIIALLASTLFLAKELGKKFLFWKKFQQNYPHTVSWQYHGDKKPGMYILKLSGNRDFRGLIGFDFSLGPIKEGGFDIFGYIESSSKNECTIALYLGNGPCTFIFILDTESSIKIELGNNNTKADFIFLPHWWQKIGFFS